MTGFNIWAHTVPIFFLLWNMMSRVIWHTPGWLDSDYFNEDNILYTASLNASLVLMFVGSFIYHTFMPIAGTEMDYKLLLMCDQCFVIIGLTLSAHTFIVYGTIAPSMLNYAFFVLLLGFCIITLYRVFFLEELKQRLRVLTKFILLRVALGLFIPWLPLGANSGKCAILGMTHAYMYHVTSFIFLVIGGVFNASRFPERCSKPGNFDFSVHSHGWWHVFTLFSCVCLYMGNLEDLRDFETAQHLLNSAIPL
eukprot:TRINITY_DN2291_c0_g1_i2.p1 TRINITY_DN2291_c0_g1~~TRINITY_DN2291_c0_g1_i2.p1  ORF type:complete len:252 (+),score=2.81 TRINITY_DN2291_c0_g1_i2:103-858(+)